MKTLHARGNILVITLITITIISVLAGASFTLTSATNRYATRDLTMHQAQALAEGSLEIAFAQWKRYMDTHLNYSNSNAPTANDLKFIGDNPPSTHPALQDRFNGFVLNPNTYKVVPIGRTDPADPASALVELSGTTAVPNVGIVPGASAFTTTTNIYRYKATAEVTGSSPNGPVTISLSRFFEVSWSPLVQKAIFYEDTMDIFPGAKMDIIGDVHANGTVYAGGGDGGTDNLHFWQKVTSVGNFNNSYNPNDPRVGSTPAPPKWDGGGQGAQLSTQQASQEVLGRKTTEIAPTGTTNPNLKGGIHEIVQIPADAPSPTASNEVSPHLSDPYSDPVANPANADPQELKDRRFYNQADYRILVNPDAVSPNPKVSVNFRPAAGFSDARKTAVRTAVAASVAAGASTIKDNRQAQNITLTNVDVGTLSKALAAADVAFPPNPADNTNPNPAFNGVLYIADVSVPALPTGGSDPNRAIRLQNGAFLSQDLTIASQNAIYLKGDYNTGNTPPSNNMNTAIPTADQALSTDPSDTKFGKYDKFTQGTNPDGSPYDRRSAMVATDAINLLSNNWVDDKSNADKNGRVATPTTMNTAMLTGNVPSSATDKYSGGVENLPRFLESWSNVGITVYGSFIELFPSKQFRHAWKDASYDAPKRRWYFERRFLRRPAPGTFIATSKQRAAWVRGINTL